MAQVEDTGLRDLVVEALEKNGSLAKIRALLRANIFLALGDEFENIQHNKNLDNITKLPEGILALSIVHEFLEFCNLKNTLFVYMSESRQNMDYKYEGKKNLSEKLNIYKTDYMKEPVLTTLLKNILNPHNKTRYSHNDTGLFKNHGKSNVNSYKDEQNCTYIVHEDSHSSTTSNSHSDNSSDEKNKLHLRLQIDNSDTDTSSDSARDKSCSEYIPSDHIVMNNHNKIINKAITQDSGDKIQNINVIQQEQNSLSLIMHELKATNSSSDSTSYVDLKPKYTSLDEKMLNTAGVPIDEIDENEVASHILVQPLSIRNDAQQKSDSPKSASSSNLSLISPKNENVSINITNQKNSPLESGKSEEYSYDFTSSQVSLNKDVIDSKKVSQLAVQNTNDSPMKNSSGESQHQVSQSSQSSVSISDVADLISEKSYSFSHQEQNDKSRLSSNQSKKTKNNHNKSCSDDSGDFTESPIPSISNLSLDIHSD